MLVSKELPILEGENKGYLINTADLRYPKLLGEEKQSWVRVCQLARGSIIEGSPQEAGAFPSNAPPAAAELGSRHTHSGIRLPLALSQRLETHCSTTGCNR